MHTLALTSINNIIPSMPQAALDRVRDIEAIVATKPQVEIPVKQFIHGGMYSRTVIIPAGVIVVGAVIKVPTILVLNGSCALYSGDRFINVQGHNVFACDPFRKQVCIAETETEATMLFATNEKDVKKAEEQFTDEWRLLSTRNHEE